jgi:hypothetical protein
MPEALTYAPKAAWHRRRLGRWLIAFVVVGASAFSIDRSLPRFAELRARHIKRVELRKEVDAQLTLARQSLDRGDLFDASLAMLRAEFPRHADADVFSVDELARIDARIAATRTPLCESLAFRQANEEAREEAADRRASIKAYPGCSFRSAERQYRRDVRTLTIQQSAAALRGGNGAAAQSMCEQVVREDPGFLLQIDATHWANGSTPR